MRPQVALSTSAVWPESTAVAFEVASRLGYDGLELMVSGDPLSQDTDTLRRLIDYHQMPVLSVHSPCLLVSQRVWGIDPWAKLMRSQIAAERLGA
jgi:sugar phosphate isomerase/epimerase